MFLLQKIKSYQYSHLVNIYILVNKKELSSLKWFKDELNSKIYSMTKEVIMGKYIVICKKDSAVVESLKAVLEAEGLPPLEADGPEEQEQEQEIWFRSEKDDNVMKSELRALVAWATTNKIRQAEFCLGVEYHEGSWDNRFYGDPTIFMIRTRRTF